MRLAKVAAGLLVLVLAGCGVGDPPAAQEPSGGQDTASGTARAVTFPVEVEHKYGTTTIQEKPEKIVTLGLSDQDVVLALGQKPIGAIDWFKERPYGLWPWTKDLWGDTPPEIVGERDDYNLEKILNLKPDLILAQYSGMSEQQYGELSKIAPTVGQPKGFDDYGAPWQDMAKLAAQAMGETAELDEQIKAIDDRFAEIREEHPDWEGKSVSVIDPFEPGKVAAFQETDPKAAFLEELGFEVPEEINEAARESTSNNAVELSAERFDMIDTDLIVVLSFDPNAAKQGLEASPVWQGLQAVKDGRVLFVPYSAPAIGAALSFNTVISIPYAIDQFVPLLEKS
ncbi:iron-siderophore ABC transporter substrate-binding protein [Actinophytocola algeriensis]|uniref:Iron complex transport system substrate-binding protein n=1 Tax=Actinophytocola algeriensis TaxID=1768010 RepID=A0A7W7VBP4_9PSEU|nr:iron-siderophore ABC transporter substrate-binding protein [Actinophytocola algeriensis]MBB4904197.1 iron complex transport system substrate-binding protein [Actinophytocola algeriensis]MBE1476946.1 iron complex transport system substrate-binding protein [Actinophytocola algeriensis]